MNEGRVEDGEVTECLICEVTMHLYDDDKGICPGCAHEGWEWTKAMYVRPDDTISINSEKIPVEYDEDFGKRCAIYAVDGRMWMKPKTDPVLRLRYW